MKKDCLRLPWGTVGGRGDSPEGTIQVGSVDEAEFGISPVKLLLLQVDGQPIGPVDVRIHDDLPGAAVHPRTFNPGRLAPVCPVHVPNKVVKTRGQGAVF